MYAEIINKYRGKAGPSPTRILGYQRFAEELSKFSPAPITHMQLYRLARGETKIDRPLFMYMAEHDTGWAGEMAKELLAAVDNNSCN